MLQNGIVGKGGELEVRFLYQELLRLASAANDMVCLWMPLSWANEVQYTGLNEAATKENDNGILCWIGRVRQRNVDLYYG